MSTAIITIVDQPGEQLSIKLTFGQGGVNPGSGAHSLAVELLRKAVDADTDDESED